MNNSQSQNGLDPDTKPGMDSSASLNQSTKQVRFIDLFRFAKVQDKMFMVVGAACSLLIGGALPLFSLLWGDMTNSFKNPEEMVQKAFQILIEYIIFGAIAIFAGWGKQYFWNAAAQNQVNQCRKAFLQALMRQEMGWFETQQSSAIVSKFVGDALAFQLAIGEKIALVIYLISMFVSGVVIAILSGWELALVILAFEPVLIFSYWLVMHNEKRRSEYQAEIFQGASGIAQEAIQSIRVVKQFNGQKHEIERFQAKVNEINRKSFSFNIKMSLGEALCLFSLLAAFTLAFWYGSECVLGTSHCPQKQYNPYSGGSILTIFFCLLMPAVNLNQFSPTIKTIAEGKLAAGRIFAVIDRQPAIKSGEAIISADAFRGVFRFEGVTFAYPKDKTKKVLQGLNLQISKRHTGLMGESGCGKSTILQLLMRFYNPDKGKITLDGVDITELDLHWLRRQIGYVGQEPLLFSTTIRENLLIGNQNATEEEMLQALKQAEALQFVFELNNKINTYVGSGGSQLSGGQKQRIAIARMLLKNPFILLLDEATSALDRRNQRLIQQTLTKMAEQKMSITVAHRLKTILNCDEIMIFEGGRLCEQGKPDESKYFTKIKDSMNQIAMEYHNQSEYSSPARRAFQKLRSQKIEKILTTSPTAQTLPTLDSQKYLLTNDPNSCSNQAESIQSESDKSTSIYRRFVSYSEGSLAIIIVGVISSIITGVSVPSLGIHVARIVTFSLLLQSNPDYYTSQLKRSSIYMLITCFVGALAVGLQYHIFLNMGCRVVNKIRLQIFNKIIKLPLPWFQNKENHAEQISVKLGADIFAINHIISRYLAHFCGALSNVVFGLLLAFYFEWRTALISIALIPLIGLVGVVQANVLSGYLSQSQGLYEQSAKMLTEAVSNIKTVISFCYQKTIISKYSNKLKEINRQQFKKKIIAGFVFGLTFFILFTIYGILFYVSTLFIRNYNLEITNSFCAIVLVLFSGIMAGNNVKYIPDLSLLETIGGKLFNLIDQLDEDQIQKRKGSKLISSDIKGHIIFRDVSFKYENREESALRRLSFEVKIGEKVGIAGSSGCGKSTILKLLLGFYSCQGGEITIDGIPIEDYNVHCLREHFGTVSQQPQLFNDTVEYNIAYSLQGAAKSEIQAAAQKAKLIEDLQSLEAVNFFARKVGPRGSHLSGGQKQRVAIARTLLRNPKMLLLDEATSALDADNEAQIQQSLDAAAEGKTTLNVTHKLEQLQRYTKIVVVDGGEVIEEGTFQELMLSKDNFYRLLHGISE